VSGWQHKDFDAVLTDVSAGNQKVLQSEFLSEGRYPIVDQGKQLVAGYTNNGALLCRSDLPVIVFGDHTRTVKYVDFPFCMGADGVKVLRPKIDADMRYLYHYLRHLRLTDAGYDRHFKYLKRSTILLPGNEEEQSRIADILDKADELRADRRAALAKLDTLTQSMFLGMFGDPASNPYRWEVRSLSELGIDFRYGTSNKSAANGILTLRIPNVVGGAIDLDDLKRVPVTPDELERLRLRRGDLLFVRTNGNADYVGRCAVYDPEEIRIRGFECDFIFASYLIRGRIPPNAISPIFLREFLSTGEGRRRLRRLGKTSAGQYNLNTKGLRSIKVMVPPGDLQQEFARRLGTVGVVRKSSESAAAKLDALFASLQHRAFRGEL
jgi:type I restriction enzyme S subunit